MSAFCCPACYGRKKHCRRCKTTHCDCSWNQCQRRRPQNVKTHSGKIGTIPATVIFRHNYKLAVGKTITVRNWETGSKWYKVTIDRINNDGYFFASL